MWSELLGFGDFYYELGVQAVEACLAQRPLNGGLMEIDDLLAQVQREKSQDRSFRPVPHASPPRPSHPLVGYYFVLERVLCRSLCSLSARVSPANLLSTSFVSQGEQEKGRESRSCEQG